MPLQMFVYPVNPAAELPDVFVEYSSIPENPVYMDIDEIDTNREEWLQAWTETVLR
jgi:thiamine transport system substrate-binding protein